MKEYPRRRRSLKYYRKRHWDIFARVGEDEIVWYWIKSQNQWRTARVKWITKDRLDWNEITEQEAFIEIL